MTTWSTANRLLAVGTIIVLVLFASFPHRLAYAAHAVAGCGLAGMGVAVTTHRHRKPGGQAFLVILGVFIAAVLAELTFAGPKVDPLDVANTTMGGALGVAAVVGWKHTSSQWRLGATGLALAIMGLLIRYPINGVVKHWRWFGT